jgi:hypothetical protein
MANSKKTKTQRTVDMPNLEAVLVQLEELKRKYAQAEEEKMSCRVFGKAFSIQRLTE